MRKCFICGKPGCLAKSCPKRKEAAKALTGAAGDAGQKPVFFGCVAGSCVAPSHRDRNARRMQSWARATAAAERAPRGFTLGDAMGGVFTQLARLEAADGPDDQSELENEVEDEELEEDIFDDTSMFRVGCSIQ